MARLRNRIVKADFWTDGELLRWCRDKRMMYQGLWALAEDSGCLEDDPFGWKLALFPSPLDADITVERLEQWRDEMVAAHKLIPYVADGKRYLFIRTFHQHEHPRNPQRPDLPLPSWVHWVTRAIDRKDGRAHSVNLYETDDAALTALLPSPPSSYDPSPVTVPASYRDGTVTVPASYGDNTVTPVPSRPVPSRPYSKNAAATIARAHEAVENRSGGGEEGRKDQDNPDPIGELVVELWEIPGWERSPKADRKELEDLARDFPAVDLAQVICEVRAKAADGRLTSGPRTALRAFAEQAARRTAPRARASPDLIRPDMVAHLAAMVEEGARVEDLRGSCASEAEYQAVLAAAGGA